MSEVFSKNNGDAGIAITADPAPMTKGFDAASRALSAFVLSSSKHLDAFDSRVAQAFGKFAGTTADAFDAFGKRAA